MIDNLPWPIALVLALIFWAFLFKMVRNEARESAAAEAARIATTGDLDPAADRFLSAIAADR